MSLRSPLGRVLGHGSAKGGSSHWYLQRLSAVALILLGIWLICALARIGPASLENVSAWLRSPLSSALTILFIGVAAYHAQLGVQVILEDYVAAKGARALLLIAVKFAFTVAALIGVLSVLRLAFGVQA